MRSESSHSLEQSPAAIPVAENVTFEQFRDEIFPAGEPMVLKGLVSAWPAANQGRKSPEAIADYVNRFDQGKPVDTTFGPPEIEGQFFYNEQLDGVNFERRPESVGVAIRRILEARGQDAPPSIYIQSAPIPDCLPGFAHENLLEFVHSSVVPRIWIGNRLTVQTHFDLQENLACVVAGRRRFTLFPPEQTPNLYPGLFELTLAGPPVSMVRLDEPDFERYPRFREALSHACSAELEAGDVLYIPYFWWHHVTAHDNLNILVNYWWNDAEPGLGSPFDALLHALLAVRDLPERQRDAWQMMFNHYAFHEHGDPVAHLPPAARGALGRHDPERRQQIRMALIGSLGRQAGLRLPGRGLSRSPGYKPDR